MADQDGLRFLFECSTPFGDIDGCTVEPAGESGEALTCSTPFGDIDGCTSSSPSAFRSWGRAQRLSATLMDARGQFPEPAQDWLCSTPFGDMDAHQGFFHLIGDAQVLNAFRRH